MSIKHRRTAVLKVETDIITSIAASPSFYKIYYL